MDLIMYNANIYTMDDEQPKCEAIAINQDQIVKIGLNQDILKLKTKNTVTINMKGQTIIPGFNDSHLHIYMTGELLGWLSFLNIKTKQEVLEKVKNEVTKNKNKNILMGHGWNQDYFTDDNTFITKDDLDIVAPNRPVILYRACGHIATLNSSALQLFGISKNINLQDGRIEINSGIVYENALSIIANNLPKPDQEQIKTTLKRAIYHANKHGITSIQTDDFFTNELWYKPITQAYLDLEKNNELNIRVYEQSLISNINQLNTFIQDGFFTGKGSKYFKIGPIKLIGDGSLGARTAAMRNEYLDDKGNFGILNYEDSKLYKIIKTAHLNNYQIAIHAIGDKTIDQVLNQYEKVLNEHPIDNHRHGIVHCQVMDLKQIKRMKNLNLIAYIQPIFVNYDQRIVEARVGKELAKTSYAFKTMLDNNVRIAIGTDSPIESLNPVLNIYSAVTRKPLDGSNEGWNTFENLTVYEVVREYTAGSSYSSFEEDIKGKLLPGYLADLVVIDKDIFNIDLVQIKSINVNMTIVGGKVVYNRFL